MTACDTPGCRRDADEADDGTCLCDDCREREAYHLWLDATVARVEQVAAVNGWSMSILSIANTGSRYYELSRESNDGEQYEELTLRISDHGSCYCSEDLSIAMREGGDDQGLAAVIRRLEQPMGAARA